MAGEPEVGTSKLGVGAIDQSERPGQQHGQHLDGDAEGGDLPHGRVDDVGQGDERRANARVLLAPRMERQIEAEAFDPATDDDEGKTQVERPARFQWRVEGVEHGRLVEQQWHRCHQEPDDHRAEAELVDLRVRERSAETLHRGEVGEPHDEEGGPDEGVQHTVDREALVVGLDDRLEIRIEVDTAVLERLKRAEERADRERRHGDPDVPADELLLSRGELEGLGLLECGKELRAIASGPAVTGGVVVDHGHLPSSPSVAELSSVVAASVVAASSAAASEAASSGSSATTLTVPYIWACPVPQYSWQM